MTWTKRAVTAAMAAVLGLGSAGCATHTGDGALIGGAGGALAGAAIGSMSHRRAGEGAGLADIMRRNSPGQDFLRIFHQRDQPIQVCGVWLAHEKEKLLRRSSVAAR